MVCIMTIIFCSRKDGGGFGDRLVGLISTYIIAQHYNRPFEHYWSAQPGLLNCFDGIKPFGDKENCLILYNRESKQKVIDFLKSLESTPNTVYLASNQPWHGFLYQSNPELFVHDTLTAYRHLWDILNPSSKLKQASDDIFANLIDSKECIGIQIRCGDFFMTNLNANAVYINQHHFSIIANLICNSIYKIHDCRNIYITSDSIEFIEILKKCLNIAGYNVLGLYDHKQHFDVSSGDIFNTVLEHYILSRCQHFLITKHWSNYGLTAALSSGSTNIWTLEHNCNITKLHLTSPDNLIKSMYGITWCDMV
jgi:hypothetical protein